ncbi:ileal sodium/bile acid cotransporter-like [Euwallacea similis]|uniref:ileal sodium/bile acid cotransporter-like n=1 Tax=Euwallacea similis TaxID=1736056 RepID=UPI00344B9A45
MVPKTLIVIEATFVLLFCNVLLANAVANISFTPSNITIHMGEIETIEYSVTSIDEGTTCELYSENEHIAYLEKVINISTTSPGSFKLHGNFLGHTFISCRNKLTLTRIGGQLDVQCLRRQRVVDTIFTASTASFVAIIYINFGCAVNWGELKNLLKKPNGPLLGFWGQFILMPLISYGMGFVLFPNNPTMRLGMFFTGVTPGGGASNIWTAILEGNIDLSILMTTVSTIAAFGMIPLWMFTLGATIFNDANIAVPYSQIATYVVGLIIPLGIGYFIQRYLVKVGLFLKKILKGFSSLLILFIIIFAIVTNLYLFELFSWQIVVAGMVIPWMGYSVGYIVAKILKQSNSDAIAIAVEIGIQNTGISIFLLRFSLDSLYADLTTVIPVSVAIMTPIPLGLLFICMKIKQRFWSGEKALVTVEKKNSPRRSISSKKGDAPDVDNPVKEA